MRRIMDRYQWKVWLSYLLLAVVVIVIFHIVSESGEIFEALGRFFGVIAPFVWGFMMAYVLNIPREQIEGLLTRVKHPFVDRKRRQLSVLLTYVGFIVIVSIVLTFILPQIYANLVDFIAFLPTLIANVQELQVFLTESELIPFVDIDYFLAYFSIDELLGFLNMDNIAAAFTAVAGFAGGVFSVALAFISSIYFLLEGERIKAFSVRLIRVVLPKWVAGGFMKHGRDVNYYFKRYIFCQVVDAIILGSIMTIALSISGVSYAFVLGPMLGFANLIPYFGAIVGTIVAAIVIMLTDGMQMGLIMTVVMLVIQQVDANIIFPRLIGGSMKIPPLLVIIGIAIGGAYYGILGMIMAIPILTVFRDIIIEFLDFLEAKREIAINPSSTSKNRSPNSGL